MADDKKEPESQPETPNVLDPVDSAPDEPKAKKSSGGKLLLLLVGIVVVAFVIVLAGTEYFANRGSDSVATSSGPSVGGPFTLVNHDGETVTEKDFMGGYMLVFFGYTYCPDVCPTALSDMAAVMDMLGDEKAQKVTPVFISVDPGRDTPEHLAEYVSFFHPKTVGLTGTEEQIKAVAREYRVYYRLNEPAGDDPQDYLVDHTSIIYLMGPDGKLVTHFSHGTDPKAMAERIGQLL
ncbi:MAG: SCO family protein [Rhodospirillales bacterium]|nr:SCO family protein [Rhodospirillales bacterium]MBO6788427.1 SCO family protein [Rhodospirillales bacterium]